MPQQVTPDLFFDKVIPQHLKDIPRDETSTLTFRVFDEEIREWTIDMGRRKVTRGGIAKPDLYVEMASNDFVALITNQLDIEGAMKAGFIRFNGDGALFMTLSKLLAGQLKAN